MSNSAKRGPSLGRIIKSIDEYQGELRTLPIHPADEHLHKAALNFTDGLRVTIRSFCLALSGGEDETLEMTLREPK